MLAYWLSPCRLLVKHEVTEAWIQNWYLLYEALLSTASGPPTLLLLPIVPCLPTYLCSKWQFNQILVSKESKVKPGSRWKVSDYLSYSLWMEKWWFETSPFQWYLHLERRHRAFSMSLSDASYNSSSSDCLPSWKQKPSKLFCSPDNQTCQRGKTGKDKITVQR